MTLESKLEVKHRKPSVGFKAEWQYWGGFFAPLLTFTIGKDIRKTPTYEVTYFKTKIGFTSKRRDIIEAVSNNFGGKVHPRLPYREQSYWDWSLNEVTTALAFLEQLEPHLPYNNNLAKVMIDFLHTRTQRKEENTFIEYDENRADDDAKYYEALKEAKRQPLGQEIWLPSKPTLAGMMDSNGLLAISESVKIYAPKALLFLKHHGILKALEDKYEGLYCPQEDKQSYYWYGISGSAVRFVSDIKDYLRLLQPQAGLLLDFAAIQPELNRSLARKGHIPELAAILGRYSTPTADLVELLRYGFHAKVAALNTKRESD